MKKNFENFEKANVLDITQRANQLENK